MFEIVLEKLLIAKSCSYEELYFFTAIAFDSKGEEYKIQGLSTPELNQVYD